jgi:hypothetical protein
LSIAGARLDGLESVFAPEVSAELDLGSKAFRRLEVSGGCLFDRWFKLVFYSPDAA